MAGDFQQPNHPDYKGGALIDGVEYWVSGWIKDGQRGKWMSLAFTPKDDAPQQQQRQQPPKPNFDDLGDDIPF